MTPATPHPAGQPNPPAAKGHYRLIDAGRGIASLWVLLFHGLINYRSDALPVALAAVRLLARWGWLGVHIFFAISGWCIAERVWKARTHRESSAQFALERVLRIYPTYWAALAATIIINLASAPFNAAQAGTLVPRNFSGWLGAALLIEPYLGLSSTFVGVAWTLVYELGFYLCAVAALSAARRQLLGGRTLFYLGAALCFAPWTFRVGGNPWFVLFYWPNFFAGMAAWWAVRRCRWLEGLGLLGAMSILALCLPAYGEPQRLTSLGAAWALAGCHRFDARLGTFRLVRGLTWIGGFSYSLYLIHVPLLTRLLNVAKRFIPSTSWVFTLWWLASILFCVGAGWMLHLWVEAPVERWRKRVTLFGR